MQSVAIKNVYASLKNEWSMKAAIDTCGVQDLQHTQISPRYQESVFTFRNADIFSGSIRTFTSPEMEVSRLDIHSRYDLTVTQNDDIERSVSTFLLKGAIHSHMKDVNVEIDHTAQQHLFIHSNIDECTHTISAGNTSLLNINLNPSSINAYIPQWQQITKEGYKRNYSKKFFSSPPETIAQTSRMHQILSLLYEDTFHTTTRNLFIESKAMELMALQMENVLHLTPFINKDNFLNKEDKEKLAALYEYININFLEPLSLNCLVKKFTLNEFKLKKGFKMRYNQSVFNYILTLRMQRAKELLANDYTVTEVADMIGYSSVHNFSNAFNKQFGYRPGMLKSAKNLF